MVKPKEAKEKILDRFKDSRIVDAFDIGSKYVFGLYPKNKSDEDLLLDNFYSVDKASGTISEYSPLMDLLAFKKKVRINV